MIVKFNMEVDYSNIEKSPIDKEKFADICRKALHADTVKIINMECIDEPDEVNEEEKAMDEEWENPAPEDDNSEDEEFE